MANNRPAEMSNIESLLRKNDIKSLDRWGPTFVSEFETALSYGDFKGMPKALRKNIVYSLQYLQYIQLQIEELTLHSVIYTQLVKSYIIISIGIIEGVFYHLLKSNNLYKKESWEIEGEPKHTNIFVENKIRKKHIVSTFYELPMPKLGDMDLESMIGKVRDKKLLKVKYEAYPLIKELKGIRNKVHLQIYRNSYDTDYNRLSQAEYVLAKSLLFRILTDDVFQPSLQNEVFIFIRPSSEEIRLLKKWLNDRKK